MPRWTWENKVSDFLRKVGKPDKNGCMIWHGKFNPNGYGKCALKHDGIVYNGAHRVAYLIEFGVFDRSKLVCHECDNRWCVNPDHLFLGTNKDNSQDMVKKGRTNNPWLGRKHKPESIAKMKACAKTDDQKRKISEAAIGRVNPMQGRTHSAETRKKISEAVIKSYQRK